MRGLRGYGTDSALCRDGAGSGRDEEAELSLRSPEECAESRAPALQCSRDCRIWG